uniref:ABC transporter substrate-binding protein n=1 Tax=Vaginimicrobium propionicum TaxID=1871034 RepID=UPI000970B7C1|nr:ABC transporter substrate-binding protein [Vaginimicrobium propionicum]
MTDSTPKIAVLRLIGLSLGLTLILSGCSTTAGTPIGEAAQDKTLTMVWWGNANEEAALHAELDNIVQLGGPQVNVEVIGVTPNENDISRRLKDGNRPDIVRTGNPQQFEKDSVDLHLDDGFWPQTELARRRGGKDGNDMAAPYDVTMTTTWINQDAFAKAGVQAASPSLPWTSWGQLLHDADIVRQHAGIKFALAIEDDPQTIISVASSFGADAFAKDQKTVSWAKEPVKQSLEMIKNGVGAGLIAEEPFKKTTSAKEIFDSGQAAVYVGPGRLIGNQSAKLVANPCEQRCGGLPSVSYLVAFSDGGKDVVEKLTTLAADTRRAEATGELPAHLVLDPDTVRPRIAELASSSKELLLSGMSPAMARLDSRFTECLTPYLDAKTTSDEVTKEMRQALESAGNSN